MSAHLVYELQPLPSSLPIVERHTNLGHSSRFRLLVPIFFSAVPKALDRPADRFLTHLNSANSE
jgi:hypothetical protein